MYVSATHPDTFWGLQLSFKIVLIVIVEMRVLRSWVCQEVIGKKRRRDSDQNLNLVSWIQTGHICVSYLLGHILRNGSSCDNQKELDS